MALMPMMPTGDPMSSPSPGPPSAEQMPPGGGGGGDLMSMLMGGGGGAPPGGDPSMMGIPPEPGSTVPSPDEMMAGGVQSQMLQIQQQIMGQFQQIEQMVMDLAGMLPGTEQIAEDIMMDFDLWKRQAVMTISQPSAAMPGAGQML